MKIRNSSRLTALVLALVMLLPLISIPAFAEETVTPSADWSEDFSTATDIGSVTNSSRPNTAKLENNSVVLDLKPNASAEYYLWKNNNNKWALTGVTVNDDGEVSGTANGITVTDSVVNTSDTTTAATTSDTANTYYVVSGTYADAMGGFCGNIGTPLHFNNTAFAATDKTVLIEWDMTFSSDAVVPMLQARVSVTGANLELFKVAVSGGKITVSNRDNSTTFAGASKTITGTNVKIAYEVDLATAFSTVYVNGEYAFAQHNTDNALKTIAISANALQIEISRCAENLNNAGTVAINSVGISVGSYAEKYNVSATDKTFYSEDFEGYTVGAAPSGSFSAIGVSDSKVVEKEGTKAWSADYCYNTVNIDTNPKIKNSAISFAQYDSIVYEVSYYFDDNAKGQLQTQFTDSTAVVGSATAISSVTWVDIYQINLNGDKPTLHAESNEWQGSGTATMERNCWNTVSAVINLKTGHYDVYINRRLAVSYQLYRADNLTNITINANQIIVGKVNKFSTSDTTCSFYIDNIKVFTGTEPTGGEYYTQSWAADLSAADSFSYVSKPASATWVSEGDASNPTGSNAIRLTMGSDKTGDAGFNFVGYQSRCFNIDTSVNTSSDVNTDSSVYAKVVLYNSTEKTADGKQIYYAYANDNMRSIKFVKNDDNTISVLSYHQNKVDGKAIAYSSITYEDIKAYHTTDKATPDIVEIYTTNAQLEATGIGMTNIDKMTKLNAETLLGNKIDKVMFGASYYIPTGAKGNFESQLHSNGFYALYNFDFTNGTIGAGAGGTAMPFKYDSTITVAVILDLSQYDSTTTSVIKGDVYVDGVYLGQTTDLYKYLTGSNGNLNLSNWNIAKVMKGSASNYAGNVYVYDAVAVDYAYLEKQAGEPLFDGIVDGISDFDGFVGDLVSTVNMGSIRLKDPTGLRFVTVVDDHSIDMLDHLVAVGKITSYRLGTIIAPEDYVEQTKVGTKVNFTKAALTDVIGENAYLDVAFGGEYYQGLKNSGTMMAQNDLMAASIVNIHDYNYDRNFCAIGYVEITLADGTTTVTGYSHSYATKSVKSVAEAALADTSANWTDAETAILNKFAGNTTENN